MEVFHQYKGSRWVRSIGIVPTRQPHSAATACYPFPSLLFIHFCKDIVLINCIHRLNSSLIIPINNRKVGKSHFHWSVNTGWKRQLYASSLLAKTKKVWLSFSKSIISPAVRLADMSVTVLTCKLHCPTLLWVWGDMACVFTPWARGRVFSLPQSEQPFRSEIKL